MFEVTFAWDGTAFAVIAYLVIYVFLASMVIWMTIEDDGDRSGLGRMVSYAVVLLIVLYGSGAFVQFLFDRVPPEKEKASTIDLAAHFGLQSGEEYPLILGQTQGSGVVGAARASGGLFGSSAIVDLRPTSTVSVGFQKEESWWQLTLPTDTIEYRKSATATMTLWLQDEQLNYYSEPTDDQVYWKQTWSDCKWQLHNLWLRCEKDLLNRELIVSTQAERAGLANVVNQYFDSARINLTDQQHTEIFPTN